jgi:hypothetical protein
MDPYSAASLLAPPSPLAIDLSPEALVEAGLTRMTMAEALRRLLGVDPGVAERALIEACIMHYPDSMIAPRSPTRRAPLAGPLSAYAAPPLAAYAYPPPPAQESMYAAPTPSLVFDSGTDAAGPSAPLLGRKPCPYFCQTGTCAFGMRCKFAHLAPRIAFNALGLPRRAGEPPCAHFLRWGTCAYGRTCRYDHPEARSA